MPTRRATSPSTKAAAAEHRSGLVDLDAAISEIRQACEGLSSQPQRSPFFFVVGAGISFPPVPLASSIIEHCREVARRYNRTDQPSASASLDAYSHWFSRAYPGARQRQQYLRSLIEKKPLSLAGLRLAHLLSARKLTNLVITTNFDDFIARALRLFGEEPAVCDHPNTVGRIDRERDDIQIVHVHGSYLFYDCANLRGEVTGRARPDEQTSVTMVGLLDSLFWNRSPLVIGYSGWEGDVIMSALKRRLGGGNPLAQNIYWFCHRASEFDSLPSWLRESVDVRFVAKQHGLEASTARPEDRAGARRNEPKSEPTLQAYEVFDQLNTAFEIGTPPLFDNPVEYFARSLEAALPESDEAGQDPYAFKALIEKLHRAAAGFSKSGAPSGWEKNLDRLRTAVRQSDYSEAVNLLSNILPFNLEKLDAEARKEVLAAAELTGSALLAKGGVEQLSPHVPAVLVIDRRLQEIVDSSAGGDLVCVVGSRWEQFGFQTDFKGSTYGAFTFHLADALTDTESDYDKDGRISLLEAVVESGKRLLQFGTGFRQTPTLAGDAGSIALFASKKTSSANRPQGRVYALLVGVGEYRGDKVHGLGDGPLNDINRLTQVLQKADRRLFRRAEVSALTNKAATTSGLRSAIAKMADLAKQEDTLLVYFSGQGTRQHLDRKKSKDAIEEILLILHDYDETKSGQLALRELIKWVAPAKARHKIVILDF